MSSQPSSQNTLERIMAERREKAEKLLASGRNPYRNDFKPSHSCGQVRSTYDALPQPEHDGPGIKPVDGVVVRLAGRAVARRGFGKTSFVPIRDATGDLQLFINVDHTDKDSFENVLPLMDVGDIIGAEGVVFWTKRGELSLLVSKLVIITKSLMPLPEKYHGLTDVELRYRQRYLDLAVNPEVREVFRKRTQIVRGIRRYLDDRDFMEVETPMMHPIIGGAAARPFITHHNALDMRLYMRIAPELYLKRLVVGGFERVYEINRNFRNEGLSRKHNPEFTMLEFYQAYATYEDLMALTEDLIESLAKEVNGSTKVVWEGHEIELARPWRRLSVKNAVVEAAGASPRVFDDPVFAAEAALEAGAAPDEVLRALIEPLTANEIVEVCRETGKSDLGELVAAFRTADKRPSIAKAVAARYASEEIARVRAGHLSFFIFEAKVETDLIQPTFLVDFPLAISPLARKKDADPAFCDRFELFIGGKEICNAFSELNDPVDQRSRFEAQLQAREKGSAETMDYDDDYCRALELGMPPAAGEGIGIDRLTMLLCGQDSIRDVILFPLMRPE